tara:strand:+ start:13125 stop:13346 length:222 start_codon:yes stop_codon:yes gene_type:complete
MLDHRDHGQHGHASMPWLGLRVHHSSRGRGVWCGGTACRGKVWGCGLASGIAIRWLAFIHPFAALISTPIIGE